MPAKGSFTASTHNAPWGRRVLAGRARAIWELKRVSKSPGVLIIVENLTMPLDRRVWQELTVHDDFEYRGMPGPAAGNAGVVQ